METSLVGLTFNIPVSKLQSQKDEVKNAAKDARWLNHLIMQGLLELFLDL